MIVPFLLVSFTVVIIKLFRSKRYTGTARSLAVSMLVLTLLLNAQRVHAGLDNFVLWKGMHTYVQSLAQKVSNTTVVIDRSSFFLWSGIGTALFYNYEQPVTYIAPCMDETDGCHHAQVSALKRLINGGQPVLLFSSNPDTVNRLGQDLRLTLVRQEQVPIYDWGDRRFFAWQTGTILRYTPAPAPRMFTFEVYQVEELMKR
jgi:hypothetical protein